MTRPKNPNGNVEFVFFENLHDLPVDGGYDDEGKERIWAEAVTLYILD